IFGKMKLLPFVFGHVAICEGVGVTSPAWWGSMRGGFLKMTPFENGKKRSLLKSPPECPVLSGFVRLEKDVRSSSHQTRPPLAIVKPAIAMTRQCRPEVLSMTRSSGFGFLLAGFCLFAFAVSLNAADWLHWRGPDQTGFSHETNLPDEWDPLIPGKANLVW